MGGTLSSGWARASASRGSSIVDPIASLPEHLRRTERWNGLRPGDPVAIAGPKIRGAQWWFRAHVRNERTGSESIEVVGGRPGDRKIRSFRPEQVYPAPSSSQGGGARRRRATGGDRPSLAEAPQLPFE